MRVGIDCDGVLVNFNEAYIDRTIHVTGQDRFPPRPFDIIKWNYPEEEYGYTAEEMGQVWDSIAHDGHFWERLAPYPNAPSQVQHLRLLEQTEAWEIYFITARPGVAPRLQTERWLTLY